MREQRDGFVPSYSYGEQVRTPRLDARLRGGAAWMWLPAIAMAVSLGVTLPSPAQAQTTLPSSSTTVNLASYGGVTSFDVPSSSRISVTSGNAVYGDGSHAWTLTNEGTIATSDSGAAGIRFNNALNNTVTNTGTIIGGNGTAVQFGSGNDLLRLGSGFSVTGAVDGGGGTDTLELLNGVDTSFHDFAGFANFQIDSGATWTNTGSFDNLGTVSGDGSLHNTGTLTATGHPYMALNVAAGGHLSITNDGVITGSSGGYPAAYLRSGTLTNGSTGRIEGYPSLFSFGLEVGSTASLNNQGYIGGGMGVYAVAGSTLTNSGTIYGSNTGMAAHGDVTNTASGDITGGTQFGVFLYAGATLTNQGNIRSLGALYGVGVNGDDAKIVNIGTITGHYGVVVTSGDRVTITNYGSIGAAAGNIPAIRLSGNNDVLQLGTGFAFTGHVFGNNANSMLELLPGVDTSFNDFRYFNSLKIDSGATWTNAGSFNNFGAVVSGGGSLHNTGTFTGSSIGLDVASGATVSITNDGSMVASTFGVRLGGGTFTNTNSGIIGASHVGAYVESGATLVNQGSIYSVYHEGVQVASGGTFTNSGSVSGGRNALYLNGGSATNQSGGHLVGNPGTSNGALLSTGATLSNLGVITGGSTGGAGVRISGTGISLGNSGTITGIYGIYADSNATSGVTVTNSGTVIGNSGTAVKFNSGNDLLRLGSGFSVTGTVDGGGGTDTLELLNGVDTGFSGFTHFEAMKIDSGATWTNSGFVVNPPTFSGSGSLHNTGTLSSTTTGLYEASGSSLTVTNDGTITGVNNGVVLNGGTLTNAGAGTIGGHTGAQVNSGATLINQGYIYGITNFGVSVAAGGSFTNSGTIHHGIYLASSGTNAAGGFITGNFGATLGTGATLTNQGYLQGSAVGVSVGDSAKLINSGTIVGNTVGVTGSSAGVTIVNSGSIKGNGGTAIQFGDGTNLLQLGTGFAFSGSVVGGTGTDTVEFLTGVDSSFSAFTHFENIQIDNGATWTNTGSIANLGTVFGGGSLHNTGTLTGGVGLYVATGSTLTITNDGSIAGTTNGVELRGGSLTNTSTGSIVGSGVSSWGMQVLGSASLNNQGYVGGHYGVVVLGTTTNSGTIVGADTGVAVSGVMTNLAGGTITGSFIGASVVGSLTNQGSIGSSYRGVWVILGGHLDNDGGTITGPTGVYLASYASHTTVTNSGLITGTGGTAVDMRGDYDVLQIGSGASFIGNVQASGSHDLLEFVSGADFSGSDFSGFETVQIDGGATWTNTGTFSFPVFVDGTGKLVNQGSLSFVQTAGNNAIISNSGSIISTGYYGVNIGGGSTLTNSNTGTIKGSYAGVHVGNAASIGNSGYIGGNNAGLNGTGIVGNYALTLTNSGTVKGVSAGVDLGGSSVGSTITNTGTIEATTPGGYALRFGSGDDLLRLGDGAYFQGYVDGGGGTNAIGFVDATGTLSGNAYFRNFQAVTITNGQDWTFAPGTVYFRMDLGNGGTLTNQLGSHLQIFGTLTNSGSFINNGTLVSYGPLINDSAGQFTNNRKLYNYGGIDNAGLFTNTDRIANDDTITNSGTLINDGVVRGGCGCGGVLTSSGSLQNTVNGYIYGGVTLTGAQATLTNAGAIIGSPGNPTAVHGTAGSSVHIDNTGAIGSYPNTPGGFGIDLLGDGVITNSAAGHGIYGYESAIRIAGTGSIANDGSMVGYHGPAVDLNDGTLANGGTANAAAYLVSRYSDAVALRGNATLANYGVIASLASTNAGVLLSGNSTVINAAGGGIAGYYGVHVFGGTNTILNRGTIAGDASALLGTGILVKGTLSNTSILNYAGGQITGATGVAGDTTFAGAPGRIVTVTNYGLIEGTGPVGIGVQVEGVVDNQAGGQITGTVVGVTLSGDNSSLTNQGTITGTTAIGAFVAVGQHQSLSNLGSASRIEGYGAGVNFSGYSGTLINEGTIAGTGPSGMSSVGLVLDDSNVVNNSGLISGADYGLRGTIGSLQITNSGIIQASAGTGIDLTGTGASTVTNTGAVVGNNGTAIAFGNDDDVLEVGAGASFTGSADGRGGTNTMRFLTGANSSFTDFSNFQSVEVQNGAAWSSAAYLTLQTLTNAGTVANSGTMTAYSLANGGTFINTGSFFGYVTLTTGAVVTNQGNFNGAIASNATNVAITNAGVMTTPNGPGIYLGAGGTVSNSGLLTAGTGPAVTLYGAGHISNTGTITGTYGVLLDGGGDQTLANSGTITGSYGVAVRFLGDGNNTLIVTPSARFDGDVVGSPYQHDTLAFDGVNGTLTGDTGFSGFENTAVLSGASWTFAGDLTFENLDNAGTLINAGTLGTGSGTFTNSGNFTNIGYFAGVLVNSGQASNSGTFNTGYDTLTNSGTFTNSGSFTGTLVNTGLVNNTGSVTGTLLLDGAGVLDNRAGGTITGNYAPAVAGLGAGVSIANAGVISGYVAVALNGGGTLTNSGTVSGQYIAVVAYNDGSGTVTISNSGTITGHQGMAIAIQGNGTVTNQGLIAVDPAAGSVGIYIYGNGSVTNTGSIHGGSYGVGIYLHTGSVTNSAGGVITGGLAGVQGGETQVSVSNAGSISGTQFGVLLVGGTLTNSGTISGGAVGVASYGTSLVTNQSTVSGTTSGLLMFGAGSSLNNSGVITGQYGVVVYGGGTVTNSGKITASTSGAAASFGFGIGSLTNTGTMQGGVFFSYGYTGSVTNKGLITADGANSGVVQISGGGTLTNSGAIIATSLSGEAAVLGGDGTIANSGTIQAAQLYGTGVALRDGRGTLTNTGLVSGGQYGVTSYGAAVVVTNQGTITGTNGYGAGVNLNDGGTVTNSGLVSGGRKGIFVYGASGTVTNQGKIAGVTGVAFYGNFADTLINSGTIIGTGGTAVDLGDGDDLVVIAPGAVFTGLVDGGAGRNVMEFAGGNQIPDFSQFPHFSEAKLDAGTSWTFAGTNTLPTGLALTSAGTIVNTGTLNGSLFINNGGSFANSGVIHGGDYGVVNAGGVLTNSGTIIGGLDGVSLSGGTLNNTGVVQGGRYGLKVTGAGTVVNSGTIIDDAIAGVSLGSNANLTNNAGATLSGVTGALFTGTNASLTNNGTITGTGGVAVQFGAGVNTLTLGTTSVLNGSINGGGGSGRIVLTGMGAFRTAVTNFGAGGSLTVANGASWSINSMAIGQVVNSGTLSLGSTPATTTITGSFAQTSSGVLTAVLDNSGASSTLNVSGSAALDGTLKITMPTVIGAPVRYTIVSAAGGVIGTFASLVPDNSALLGSALSYDANDAYVTVFQRKLTAPSGVVETPNQLALAAAFDAAVPTDPMGFGTAVGVFNQLPATGFVNALNQMSGEPLADVSTAALSAGRQFLGAIRRHARVEQNPEGTWSLWGQAYLQTGHLDGDGNAHRMTQGLTGGMVGADYQLLSAMRLGGVIGFGHGHFNVSDGLGGGEADYTEVAFTTNYAQGPLQIDMAVGGVFGNGSTSRNILQGTTLNHAVARQGSSQFVGALEAGYRVSLTENVDLTPFARLQTGRITRGGFSETGGGIFNLTATDQSDASTQTILGARFDTPITLGVTPVKLDARLGWSHELDDVTRLTGLSLAGNRFAIAGASLMGDAADIGLGLSTPVFEHGEAALGYDGSYAGTGESHAVNVGLRFTW